MSQVQMLPGQMSPLQLESVQCSPINLSLKFGQNRAVTAEILLTLSLVWVLGGGGVKSFSYKTQTKIIFG